MHQYSRCISYDTSIIKIDACINKNYDVSKYRCTVTSTIKMHLYVDASQITSMYVSIDASTSCIDKSYDASTYRCIVRCVASIDALHIYYLVSSTRIFQEY